MATAAKNDPQTSLYETTIDDPTVEELLEARDKAKSSAQAVSKKYRDADQAAKAALNTLDLGSDAPVRIGRFVVVVKDVPARTVAFETNPTTRINISPLDEAA